MFNTNNSAFSNDMGFNINSMYTSYMSTNFVFIRNLDTNFVNLCKIKLFKYL